MADLRLLKKTSLYSSDVLGYYAKGDKGGGSYYYDSIDTSSGAYFTGSVSGSTLTVTAVTNGTLAVGQMVCRGDTGATVAWISALGTGSGGTGTYMLSESATVTSMAMMADNGGTTIIAADGGRWKLAFQGELWAKQFGAKADDSQNDRFAIINMYAALASAGGGKAQWNYGTYLISGSQGSYSVPEINGSYQYANTSYDVQV